ncbi:MAG TPA: hypothetical protein VN370_05930, partial [Desulfitobacteriaceae bacterium]|nr:hypothetical protein [Desulfitobacteriaceae bacterium]
HNRFGGSLSMRISSISPAASSTDKYLPGDISKMKQIENRIERFQQLIEENQSKDDNKIKQSNEQVTLNNKNSTAQQQNSNYFIGSIIDIQV